MILTMSNKQIELLALRMTTLVCLGFGVLGIVVSIIAHANSMLLDGLYSMIQSLFIIGSNKVVMLLFKQKDDERFPFGYGAFEPFFLVLRSLVLLSMVATLGIMAAISLTKGGYAIDVALAFNVSVLSLVICSIVWATLAHFAKKLASPMLRSESKAWLMDTMLSLAAVLAIALVWVIRQTSWAYLQTYIDPALTLLFLFCLSPMLIKDVIHYSRELLGAAPASAVQGELEKIVNRFVRSNGFLRSEVYASKRGRSLMVVIYIYLKKERTVLELDAIRLQMVQELYAYSSWCEADILFTLDERWVEYSLPLAAQNA